MRAASIAWPAIVAVVELLGVLTEGGVRNFLVNRLADFSLRHFVQAVSRGDKAAFCLGYRRLGRDFHVLKINADAIVSLDWRTGQATALAGRDMGDWRVALWCAPPSGSRREPAPGGRDEEVVCIGRPQTKSEAAAFGRSLSEFLRSAGVELTPREGDAEFRAKPRRGDP